MVIQEMRKKKKNKKQTITVEDYIKAVKKADRELQLSSHPGWQRTTNVHKSKKTYNRKNFNKNLFEGEE